MSFPLPSFLTRLRGWREHKLARSVDDLFRRTVQVLAESEKSNLLIAERLCDLGNLLFIALVASQFLGNGFNSVLVVAGSGILLFCYTFGYNILKGRKL